MFEQTNTPRRKNLRLRDFDYSQPGAYFVTLCTNNRICLLGNVVDDQVLLSEEGRIAYDCLTDLPNHYAHVEMDEFVVMPNHVHGIIVITDPGMCVSPNETGAGLKPAPTRGHTLSEVIRGSRPFPPAALTVCETRRDSRFGSATFTST